MEKTIRNIFRKIDNKKISIEMETVEGGCIALPAFTIKGEHNGKEILSKSIEIDEAFEKFLDELD